MITVKAVTNLLDVYPVVKMVTIENTTPTNKVMNVSSVGRPVHLAVVTILVSRVGLDTGGLLVRTLVVNVQAAIRITVARLAVLMDILCTTVTRHLVMNVNGVNQGLALLSVCQATGEPRVRIIAHRRVTHVHQTQLVRVVKQCSGEAIVRTAVLHVCMVYVVNLKGVQTAA